VVIYLRKPMYLRVEVFVCGDCDATLLSFVETYPCACLVYSWSLKI
jgi:hypothetical protein